MPRIYLPISCILDNLISITNEKAHYLTSVLRCGKGDELIIFDGKGDCFRTTILKADRREIITEVIEKFQCNAESNINITLVQGLLKGEKMDMVIQKTTELGVKEIIPVVTERSQLRETRKVARWRKIAEEASRQSGRSIIPVIHNPIKFLDILNLLRPSNKVKSLLFYEEGGMKLSEAVSSFVPRPSSLFVFVGPEGGFTKEEVFLAKEKGLLVTSLGERILRAETAAISAVALVQFLLGDMG
jgi:16S rRNA (uracil1498-N3)-methyltransferase